MTVQEIGSKASGRFALIAVLATCLCLRLALAFYYSDADVTRDAYNYREIGRSMADGKGFAIDAFFGDIATGNPKLTAYGNPIYPALLASIYWSIGEEIGRVPSVSVVQSVMDTLSCFLVFLLAYRLLDRRKAALVAAAVYAIYPPFLLSVITPMTETSTILLTLVAAYALIKAIGGEDGDEAAARGGFGRYVLAGALMGLLILLKPAMLGFPFAVGLMLFALRERVGGWLVRSAIYIGVAYLVVSPWTLRNYAVFGVFLPVASHGGQTLWGGTGPADGICLGGWAYPVASVNGPDPGNDRIPRISEPTYRKITAMQERLSQLDEIQLDKALRAEAIKEIKQHPGRYLFLAVKKPFRLWFNLWNDFPPSMSSYAIAGLNAVLLALAVLGYRRSKIDYRFKILSVYLIGYTTVLSMLAFANLRYSYPLMPFVIILAASVIGARKKQPT